MTTYFIADTHFGHKNILHLSYRPFETIEEMGDVIIRNINERVLPNDTLYVLGDFSMRISHAEAIEYRNRINCKNIHLVTGNHDLDWEGYDTFSSVSVYKEIKLYQRKIVLFHYPIAEWNGFYAGDFHFHGHIHSRPMGSMHDTETMHFKEDYNQSNIDAGRRLYDVGCDANNFAPISAKEILEKFGINVDRR